MPNKKFMSAAQYVDEIVVPTVREARDDPRSRRRAYLACIVVHHIEDYLKCDGAKNVRSTMRRQIPLAYEVVRGVCNGAKHAVLDRPHDVPFTPGQDRYWIVGTGR